MPDTLPKQESDRNLHEEWLNDTPTEEAEFWAQVKAALLKSAGSAVPPRSHYYFEVLQFEEFNPEQHPKDAKGRFTHAGGVASGAEPEKSAADFKSKADHARYLLGKGHSVADAARMSGAHYSQVHGIAKNLKPKGEEPQQPGPANPPTPPPAAPKVLHQLPDGHVGFHPTQEEFDSLRIGDVVSVYSKRLEKVREMRIEYPAAGHGDLKSFPDGPLVTGRMVDDDSLGGYARESIIGMKPRPGASRDRPLGEPDPTTVHGWQKRANLTLGPGKLQLYHSPTRKVGDKAAGEVVKAMETLQARFPAGMDMLKRTTIVPLSSRTEGIGAKKFTERVLARYFVTHRSIEMNPVHFGPKGDVQGTMLRSFSSTWHPTTADPADAAQSIVTHEFGHHLDMNIEHRIAKLVNESYNAVHFDKEGPGAALVHRVSAEAALDKYKEIVKQLQPVSEYAKTNRLELVAEAVAAGIHNPARYPEAAVLVRHLEYIYDPKNWSGI